MKAIILSAKAQKIINSTGECLLKNKIYTIKGYEKYLGGRDLENFTKAGIIEDIDKGVSGNLLFLIELYRINPQDGLIDKIIEGGKDLIHYCNSVNRSHCGFYKGRAGVSYTLVKIYEISGIDFFLEEAANILKKEIDTFMFSEFATNRLYDGRSGTLLVLLYLYKITKRKWIIDSINNCIKLLTASFYYTDKGILWKSKDNNIQALNSFTFGSSGVAFALAEASRFFNHSELFLLSEAIVSYEKTGWNTDFKNWNDYRKEIITGRDYHKHKTNFLNKNFRFFNEPMDTTGWAHGTAGICMTRLNLLLNSNCNQYFRDINKGITKLVKTHLTDLGILNGLSGIGSFHLECLKQTGNQRCYNEISKIIQLIENKDLSKMDFSLFYGVTGIAYFLLHTKDPDVFHSVLYPVIKNDLESSPSNQISFKTPDLWETLVNSSFAKTAKAIEAITNVPFQNIFMNTDIQHITNYQKSFLTFLDSINMLDNYEISFIKNVFRYENFKYKMILTIESNSLLQIKKVLAFEQNIILRNKEDAELLEQILVINDSVRILKTKWNWILFSEEIYSDKIKMKNFINSESAKNEILIKWNRENNSFFEEKLDTFGLLVCEIFQEPKSVNEAIEICIRSFKIEKEPDVEKIKRYAKKYIKLFIYKDILQSYYYSYNEPV